MAGGNSSKNITKYKKSYSKTAARKSSSANSNKKNDSVKKTKAIEAQPEKKGMSFAAAVFAGACLAFVLELSNFNVLGKFGGWLKYAQFGLFGSMAYIFPAAVLLLFIGLSAKVKRKKFIIHGVILFIFICSFSHLLSSHSLNNRNILSYFTNCAQSETGGGIIGGTLALGLYTLLSQTGAVIINILVILICIFFLFEDQIKRLFAYIFSGSDDRSDDSYDYYEEDEEDDYDEYENIERKIPDTRMHRPKVKESDRKRATARRSYEEPVYITEDDEGTVIRLVKNRRKHGRSHNAQMIRINKKAQPLRDGTTSIERAGHKVKGVSESLEMLPHNASGDEIHEITRKSGKQSQRRSSSRAGNFFADTVIPKPSDADVFNEMPQRRAETVQKAEPVPEDVPERKKGTDHEAYVTNVTQAAVNRRAKEARPVKVRKGDDQIPGQQEIDQDKIRKTAILPDDGDSAYFAPPMELLFRVKLNGKSSEAELERIARNLEEILEQFGVHVTVTDIQAGPSVTRFELTPELGTRVNKITSLADDLKLNLGVTEIRIEAPIPGRQAVGIEIPNKNRQTVYMRELLEEPTLINHQSKIAFAAGKDISGNVIVSDIAKMPHLLVAGTTGSGKSVFLNTILMTILYRAKPSEVGLIIIDPKQVEFGIYAGIPHLMKDVVTDPGQAVSTLRWAVNEMSNRYQRMKLSAVRDFKSYNAKIDKGLINPEEENPRKMNQIIIIIDELADLMMVAKKEAESLICRLAQLARAAGIHLIIATQRPSVDVVTGLIKANVPARVALLVSSQIDSRTIIDMPGAEKLLGNGDMLFYPTGFVKPVRVQGAFVSDEEVQKTVDFLIANNKSNYFAAESEEIEKFMNIHPEDGQSSDGSQSGEGSGKYDECFYEAGKMCIEMGKASSSMLQRRFSLGFNRAARIIEQLEDFGVVGPQNGAKPRQILVDVATFEEMYNQLMNS